MGEVIAIAWNGSTETALTMALGMPFIKQAKHVAIVAVGAQHMPEPGPEGEELAPTPSGTGSRSACARLSAGKSRRANRS